MALFAVLDVETTGLSPAKGDRVVEIAVIVLDEQFRVVRMFDSLVNPERSIPSHVTQIHGISHHAVRSAPTFADLLPGLMNCFSGITHLVAHNRAEATILKRASTISVNGSTSAQSE